MSKTNIPGIFGALGTSQTPAVTLEKAGAGTAVVRTFAGEPDGDVQHGPGVGFTVSAAPVTLADAAVTADDFVAAHQAVIFLDDEDGLAALVPFGADLIDAAIIVRDASKTGQKVFTFVVGPPVALVSIEPGEATLESTTPEIESVAAATDEVFGSATFVTSLDRVFRFPGADPGSPFSATWTYAAGVLSNVPGTRAELTMSVEWQDMDPARWEVWLQRNSGGGWTDYVSVYDRDFGAVLGVQLAGWSDTSVRQFAVAPNESYQLVIRHNDVAARAVTVDQILVTFKSIAAAQS